ncbi:MAG: hypothetical protein IPH62_00775 [Ignavibacteriae bacterium]|nr:hypothetical protein [Ignavibacteriota bacterium]
MNKNFLFILFVIISQCLYAQLENKDAANEISFLQSRIKFDNSSLKKIVLDPETVLNNSESFWENDSAYKLYKLWHQQASFPINMDQWKNSLKSFLEVPLNERQNNAQLMLSSQVLENENHFEERAIPFLYSFLPENCPSINATIYFTTAIIPNGFQIRNDLVIYGENADKENLIIHELFHRCQRACKILSKSDSLNNELDQIYLLLWAEGTATYIGYKALEKFPNVDPLLQKDYQLLENEKSVKNLFAKLNNFYRDIPNLLKTPMEMQKNLIQIGVMERAFYMVGCKMASQIDNKLGRNAFKELFLHGPKHFIQTYNSLVGEEEKIFDLYSVNK